MKTFLLIALFSTLSHAISWDNVYDAAHVGLASVGTLGIYPWIKYKNARKRCRVSNKDQCSEQDGCRWNLKKNRCIFGGWKALVSDRSARCSASYSDKDSCESTTSRDCYWSTAKRACVAKYFRAFRTSHLNGPKLTRDKVKDQQTKSEDDKHFEQFEKVDSSKRLDQTIMDIVLNNADLDTKDLRNIRLINKDIRIDSAYPSLYTANSKEGLVSACGEKLAKHFVKSRFQYTINEYTFMELIPNTKCIQRTTEFCNLYRMRKSYPLPLRLGNLLDNPDDVGLLKEFVSSCKVEWMLNNDELMDNVEKFSGEVIKNGIHLFFTKVPKDRSKKTLATANLLKVLRNENYDLGIKSLELRNLGYWDYFLTEKEIADLILAAYARKTLERLVIYGNSLNLALINVVFNVIHSPESKVTTFKMTGTLVLAKPPPLLVGNGHLTTLDMHFEAFAKFYGHAQTIAPSALRSVERVYLSGKLFEDMEDKFLVGLDKFEGIRELDLKFEYYPGDYFDKKFLFFKNNGRSIQVLRIDGWSKFPEGLIDHPNLEVVQGSLDDNLINVVKSSTPLKEVHITKSLFMDEQLNIFFEEAKGVRSISLTACDCIRTMGQNPFLGLRNNQDLEELVISDSKFSQNYLNQFMDVLPTMKLRKLVLTGNTFSEENMAQFEEFMQNSLPHINFEK